MEIILVFHSTMNYQVGRQVFVVTEERAPPISREVARTLTMLSRQWTAHSQERLAKDLPAESPIRCSRLPQPHSKKSSVTKSLIVEKGHHKLRRSFKMNIICIYKIKFILDEIVKLCRYYDKICIKITLN